MTVVFDDVEDALSAPELTTAKKHDFLRRALLFKYSPGHPTWGRGNIGKDVRDQVTDQQRMLLEPPYVYKRQRLE